MLPDRRIILALFFCIGSFGCDSGLPNDREAESVSGAGAVVQISQPGAKASEPALAAASDGRAFAVWVEHGKGRDADVYVRAFDADGNALSEQIRVNPVPGQATAWYGDPPAILIGSNDKIYVGWTAKFENAPAPANTLYLSISSDGGKNFEAPVKVNDDNVPASHGMHSMALGKDGQVYFAWIDERYLKSKSEPVHAQLAGHGAFAVRADHTPEPVAASAEPDGELYFAAWNGGASFGPNKRLAEHVCPCCKTSIIAAGDGAIHIGFRKVFPGGFRHIAVVSSPKAGPFSEPVQVSDDQWQINACPVSGPAMYLSYADRLTVAWYTEGTSGQKGLYLSQSDDGGASFSPRQLVDSEAASGTPILTENHIVWRSFGKFMSAPINYAEQTVGTRKSVAEGEHAAAVESNSGLRFAISRKVGKMPAIWLTRTHQPENPERLDVHVFN